MRVPTHRLLSLVVVVSLLLFLLQIQLIAKGTTTAPAPVDGFVSSRRPTESIQSNVTAEYRRLHFVLHVGPGKMGTSSLQCGLFHASHWLQEDSYVYLGKNPVDNSTAHCQPAVSSGLMTDLDNPKVCRQGSSLCWERARAIWQQHAQEGHNLVLSHEGYAVLTRPSRPSHVLDDFVHNLLQGLFQWDISIVIGYRRYYEWIVSLKHDNDRTKVLHWPPKGAPIRPLFEEIQEWLANDGQHHLRHQYTDRVLEAFSKYLSPPRVSISILNVHEPNPILKSFACQQLQRGKNVTCHHAAQREDRRVHVSVDRSYDRLSVEAWQRGWIHANATTIRRRHKRSRVADLAKKRQQVELNRTSRDFVQQCPSDEQLRPLLERSLAYEQAIVPEFYKSPLGKRAHEEAFWADVRNGKFCSMDVNRVLEQDDSWRLFFQSL